MVALPKPCSSAYFDIFCCASSQGSPLNSPELISRLFVSVKGSTGLAGRAIGGIAFAPRQDHDANVEAVLLGELVIALVVRRHRHDGAGAVIHQDVVGHPDGHVLVVERIDGVALGEDSVLLDGADVAGFLRLALLGDQLFDLGCASAGSLAIRSATSGCSGASCSEVAP